MKLRHLFSTFFDYLCTPTIVHAANANSEIRQEIEFHLMSSIEEKMESGLSGQESQKLALQQFGDVNSVLRDCSAVTTSRHMVFHRLHQGLTLGLAVAVGLLGYSFAQMSVALAFALPTSDSNFVTATGYSLAETHGDITGTVKCDKGQAIASANVLAVVKSCPPDGFRQQSYMTTTAPDGRFSFKDVYAPDHKYEVQVAAIAEGHSLNSEYINLTTGTLEPFCFQCQQASPFELRFESGDGRPIEGVSAFPFKRVDNEGNQHSVYFSSADPIVRKSNPAGTVSMPHFFPGERATVFVRFPDSDWQTREIVVPIDEHVAVIKPATSEMADGDL